MIGYVETFCFYKKVNTLNSGKMSKFYYKMNNLDSNVAGDLYSEAYILD